MSDSRNHMLDRFKKEFEGIWPRCQLVFSSSFCARKVFLVPFHIFSFSFCVRKVFLAPIRSFLLIFSFSKSISGRLPIGVVSRGQWQRGKWSNVLSACQPYLQQSRSKFSNTRSILVFKIPAYCQYLQICSIDKTRNVQFANLFWCQDISAPHPVTLAIDKLTKSRWDVIMSSTAMSPGFVFMQVEYNGGAQILIDCYFQLRRWVSCLSTWGAVIRQATVLYKIDQQKMKHCWILILKHSI